MIAGSLEARLGGAWTVRALGASRFCDTWRADGNAGALFVKAVPAARADVLEAEADGLQALAVPGGPRVPAPGDGRFGWWRDNWLGGTPQANRRHADWQDFLARQRLRPLAAGLPAPLPAAVERVIAALPGLFDDGHRPRPSRVHGDLWSGNWGALADGTPVVFDPAVSVSDAEAELAMMELFGAPPPGFWTAYDAVAPRAPGYARRRPVYQLVHLLNHARLFGGGYAQQALALARTLLRLA